MKFITYLKELVKWEYVGTLKNIDIYSLDRHKFKRYNKHYTSSNIMHNLHFQSLFNHRWFFYLHISHLKPVDLTPFVEPMCEAYDRMELRYRFDNLFLLPVNSPAYESLSQTHKDTFSHNLLNFYDLIYYSITHFNPNELDFKSIFEKCINEVIKIKVNY